MKAAKFLLLVALFIGQVTFANSTKPKKEGAQVVSESVSSLLEEPTFEFKDEIKASVLLIVNSKKQAVVIDVHTENKDAEAFIKLRLNYSSIEGALIGEQFTIPVRLVPGL